ncbi:glycosyl hydrolases family 31-domain-containing protein [Epithele typhae]|uniref:glycosyl hydrolases family 31-domain-containing protein n=1 Tax=Epithele typhae TaxID=378194 RepID=UPI002007A985|nr:glycosyl hydrolases family 31-domain-containing protein [Epithele typhae]KAH9934091.1 glycosyl hydrolases family 31-domain-containing protein [Epithele typhae]
MAASFFAGALALGASLYVGKDQVPMLKAWWSEAGNIVYDGEVRAAFSRNVSSCPGYELALSAFHETDTGIHARLDLAGPACNAYGHDIETLILEVTYETQDRLHVNIYDKARSQFAIPSSVIDVDQGSREPSLKQNSDLVFNYEASPFAFWITRRSEPDSAPLFDTRASSLPKTPIAPIIPSDKRTALNGFPLVFEDRYLQLTSALPLDTNIYGLGEVVATNGFRRDTGAHGGEGTIQTMWARDAADPEDENIYGSHPIYMEHRYDEKTKKSKSHGVFLFNSAGSDTLLLTPPSSSVSLLQYRILGGNLDFYFLSGPGPQEVIRQYGALIGLPTWQPLWGFGFHLCRWGYMSIAETRDQVQRMRDANVPLEVMWNDIDLYHDYRDFTADPVSFNAEEVRTFIRELGSNHQYYIPIVDAAVAHQTNKTDVVSKNPNGTEYVGQVWPGYTVFPDWFSNNAASFWTDALTNWSKSGVEFSGIWLDMNEIASFCSGSCGSNADWSDTSVPFSLPGTPGNPVKHWPEGYDASVWGESGNITINGKLTYDPKVRPPMYRRALDDGPEIDLSAPPYAIHNAYGELGFKTVAPFAMHANGISELDVHNLWGLMEEKVTHGALLKIRDNKRPFIISRSTFAGSGKWTGHWLGDNFSKWSYMHYSIQGVLQFQLFQIPMVGADTCGFEGNSDEELCGRWMQLSAFLPFYRNHNILGGIPQEPYVWDSVASASRSAITTRYSMLPYWYTLFANSSTFGSAPVRALFFEFPDEPELFPIDQQFLLGRDILVTPVLTPNASTVAGTFPGRGTVTWRDWYTHASIAVLTDGSPVTLDAPLGHINVHVRDGAAILLHAEPGYTTAETAAGPYALLVSQDKDGYAFGTAYVDDGDTMPPTPNSTIKFVASKGKVTVTVAGNFHVAQKLETVTVLGVGATSPAAVQINGREVPAGDWEYVEGVEKLVVMNAEIDLNEETTVTWA